MQNFDRTTAKKETAVPLSDQLFSYLFASSAPAKTRTPRSLGRTVAFLLLYMTFFAAIALVAMLNTAVITAETAFFTLLPLSVAAVILLVYILTSNKK